MLVSDKSKNFNSEILKFIFDVTAEFFLGDGTICLHSVKYDKSIEGKRLPLNQVINYIKNEKIIISDVDNIMNLTVDELSKIYNSNVKEKSYYFSTARKHNIIKWNNS